MRLERIGFLAIPLLALGAATASAQDTRPLGEHCPRLSATDVAAIEDDARPSRGLARYARNYCVTMAEAQRRMDLQMRDSVSPRTEPGPPPPPPPDGIGTVMAAVRDKEVATFAGLWIEHQPRYRVVVAFTRDAARTLAKYTRDPLFVPLDRPGPSLTVLRTTQDTLTRELTAIKARPAGSSSNEKTGRVEIALAVDPAVVRDAERAGRIRIPDYVDLIAPPPLPFDAAVEASPDTRLRAFPRAYYRRSGISNPMPPGAGRIVLRDRCLTLAGEDGTRTILWPNEAAVDLSRKDAIGIVDRANGNRITIGDTLALEVSAMPKGWDEPVIDANRRCPGPYVFVTGFEPWTAYRERMLQAQALGLARDTGITAAAALSQLRARSALTDRLVALSGMLSQAAPDRFGGYIASADKATLYLVGGADAGLLAGVPADLRPRITTVAVPRPLSALTAERQRLRDELRAAGIEARVGWDIQHGRLTLGEVADLAALARAVRERRVTIAPGTDLTTNGATPAGGYLPDALEAADRRAEASPDFAAIRALIEATRVPAILAGGGETDPPRRPGRAQSLDVARFLVTIGLTAADIRALRAAGVDPVDAWIRQNGFSTPANRAVLAREVVVAEPVRVHDARLGDGYRSTVVLRVVEGLKGAARPGDMLTMRLVSGHEGDDYVQSNEEPPLLDGLPGAMTPGTRWLLYLSDGFYARNAALVGGRLASPSGARWYAAWYGIARVEGDRVLPTRGDDRAYALADLRREIAPVDAAFDRLPGRTPPRSDPPPVVKPDGMLPVGTSIKIDRAVFEGRWSIAAFDGGPPVAGGSGAGARAPSQTFSRTGYGGTAGCNALGGIGTLHGARFYTQAAPQTVMACLPALAARGAVLANVMRASPGIGLAPDGGITPSGGGHRLTLTCDPTGEAPPVEPAPSLVGARFSMYAVDGAFPTPRTPRGDTRTLAFDVTDWRATPVCATLWGTWRQEGWALRGSDAATGHARCSDGAAVDAAVSAVFATDPGLALGPNGEFVLAGGGHRISGVRNTLVAERDMPVLAGTWDIVEIDGKPPMTMAGRSQHPTMQFGRGAYGGSTGCNTILGQYIAQRGRLYTNPGPTTQQGCGALTAQEDRIYAVLRGAPFIARAGSAVRLVDDDGSILLRRVGRPTGPSAGATAMPVRYVGKSIAVNGRPVETRSGDPASVIILSGSEVRIDIGCGTISAAIVRRGVGTFLTSTPRSGDGSRCVGERLNQHRLLMHLSNGATAGMVDANGDLLLAGDGAWLTARRN